MVLPFRPIAAEASIRKQRTAPEPAEETDEMPAIPVLQDLLQFSDKDFVAVLHACEPQTVLLALSGASKPFIKRVEKLIPAKDVKRLRVRLSTLSPIQLREVDAAQKELANTALRMLESGEIGATASVSFTAAA